MKLMIAACFVLMMMEVTSGQQQDEQLPPRRRNRDRYIEPPPANGYQFSYNTGSAGPAQIFREETKDLDGSIVGKYGYVDPNGELRVINYRAAPRRGFVATGDTGVEKEPTTRRESPPAPPVSEGGANSNLGPYPYAFHYNVPEHMGAYQYQQLYY